MLDRSGRGGKGGRDEKKGVLYMLMEFCSS
jgi:hypothetical protein